MNKYFMDKMEEECGVFGIYSKGKSETALKTYYALYARTNGCCNRLK